MLRRLLTLSLLAFSVGCGQASLDATGQAITGPRLTHLGGNTFHDNAQGFDCSYEIARKVLDIWGNWQPVYECMPLPCYLLSETRAAVNPATGRYERMVIAAKGKSMPKFGVIGGYLAPSMCSREQAWSFKLVLTPVTMANNWPADYPMTPDQLAMIDFYRTDFEGCEIDGKRRWCEGAPLKDLPPGCTMGGCITPPGGF